MLFRGSGVALVTPFLENGDVDFAGLEELINFHLENSTDAIIITGTTGEASTMSDEEQLEVIKKCVEVVDGKIPVIAGTGTNNTLASAEFSKLVSNSGVDGLLVVTPYYNKANRQGLYEHFKAIANASSVPVILYTVPGRTAVPIPVDLVVELAKIENIVGIKDATGDLAYTVALRSALPNDFAIYSGNDDVVVPLLSVGGDGVISVSANVCPQETHDMCQAFFDGDTETAKNLQIKLFPLIDSLFVEVNPIPVKEALNQMGMPAGAYRLPLWEPTQETKDLLSKNLKDLGKI
ncbi:MAG: 4-hydroxy-tetrahydrodipicolinate synthase [Tissierellia bacterium]|nr:4-hydroxy-tetrahydrodipicolinate synthase [Tissierellia bacterium]